MHIMQNPQALLLRDTDFSPTRENVGQEANVVTSITACR